MSKLTLLPQQPKTYIDESQPTLRTVIQRLKAKGFSDHDILKAYAKQNRENIDRVVTRGVQRNMRHEIEE